MCGIAGFTGLEYTEKAAEAMLESMRHRGPDGNGKYINEDCCFLHTRLAIVDISGGKQPMMYETRKEKYVLIYNGELYNTEEIRLSLKKLGHTFNSYSDTEVVLHAYVQWGEKCVEHFNGIFAFAVWEERAKRLFLARDRIGVKPLFYKLHDAGIIFASEIKTILKYPTVRPELDAEGATQIVMLGPGRIPGSGVLKGIAELEPGCCGFYCGKRWFWKRYWKLKDREHTDSFEETAESVRWLVTDAIQRQMVSDVPVGTFLSGGLDSSLISAICGQEMKNRNERLKTFSLDYENNDKYFVPGKFQPNSDTEYIGLMQEYLRSDACWTVIRKEYLVNALYESVIARDLPGMADVDASLLIFCKDIKSNVKVALSGECADEIFGGYPWYRDPLVRSADGFPWAQNTKERTNFLASDITDKVDAESFIRDQYQATLDQCDINSETSALERRMKEMVNLNQRWFMQTLLDRKDRMSMHSGLEVRVPFCDYRIAEYLYGVPWEFKDHKGQEKGLLRYAMGDILPKTVLNRKKSPYPKTHDPAYFEAVRNALSELLHRKDAPVLQIIKKKALMELLTGEQSWPWYGQLMRKPQTIAYMLQINFWLEHYHIELV